MGQSGTEVAKEASSIVLVSLHVFMRKHVCRPNPTRALLSRKLDDSFPSLVLSLLWGRAVNASVRKFLQFQMTVNFAAVITAFFSSLVNERGEGVLGAVQMLWVRLLPARFCPQYDRAPFRFTLTF
jgi:Ca2+-transporting ATPase